MRKISLICLFISQLALSTYGQLAISIETRFGVPTNFSNSDFISSAKSVGGNNNEMTTNFDFGTMVLAQYPIWIKRKVYIQGGFEWSQTKTTLALRDVNAFVNRYNLVLFHPRIALHLGLNKEFEIIQNKLFFSLGFNFVKRFHYKGTTNFTNDWFDLSANSNSIGYYYDVNVYYDKKMTDIEKKASHNEPYFHINANFNLSFSYSINRNWQLGLSLSHTRNNYFYFDYLNQYSYYKPPPLVSKIEQDYVSDQGEKFAVRENFLYTGITVNYLFNKKEKERNKM